MLEIDNTIISLDIIEKKFCCDLEKCHGACCLYGDAGAPLEKNEIKVLEEIFPFVKKHLSLKGAIVLEAFGLYTQDDDREIVTPLIEGKECAYSFVDSDNILKCAIEKAFLENKISFQKPISCHLYPIRIHKYNDYDAINYHKWKYCECAVEKGNSEDIPIYRFLKTPLIRKYGQEWFEKLDFAAKNYLNRSDFQV